VQPLVLLLALGTLLLTLFLYTVIPKGLFPIQDTGEIQGISEADQNVSYTAMAQRQQALANAILQDPASATSPPSLVSDGTNTTLNNGRIQIDLKPLAQRNIGASDLITRLQDENRRHSRHHALHAAGAGPDVDDRVSLTQYQYTLETPIPPN